MFNFYEHFYRATQPARRTPASAGVFLAWTCASTALQMWANWTLC